ncbi:Uncharacterised protein [Halioglobus japonicus]|nr:Uncharacterised protein [Halioglobus japonicus]
MTDNASTIEYKGRPIFVIFQNLFDFDVSQSSYTTDYNLAQVTVDQLLENYRDSIWQRRQWINRSENLPGARRTRSQQASSKLKPPQ